MDRAADAVWRLTRDALVSPEFRRNAGSVIALHVDAARNEGRRDARAEIARLTARVVALETALRDIEQSGDYASMLMARKGLRLAAEAAQESAG